MTFDRDVIFDVLSLGSFVARARLVGGISRKKASRQPDSFAPSFFGRPWIFRPEYVKMPPWTRNFGGKRGGREVCGGAGTRTPAIAKLRELTAVVGGRAALSFPHNRAAALKRWRARERHAPYGAHRAETIVACGLPLDVADHLALGVSALAHATS